MSWWEHAYRGGRIPWDPGPYDGHLPFVLKEFKILPGPCIDIGCGTGKSLIWLAERRFQCTGIDVSSTALQLAEKNADKAGVKCRWLHGAFPDKFSKKILVPSSFVFVMERGCMQHLRNDQTRLRRFVEAVARLLTPDGYFYSLTASSNSRARYSGPPQWTAKDLVTAVESFFEIRLLKESVFTPGEEGSIPAWLCVMQRKS